MKTSIDLYDVLFFLHRTLQRIIIRAKLDHCIKDLAHIEATRRNDLHAERICLKKMIELKSMLNDLESTAAFGKKAVQNRK